MTPLPINQMLFKGTHNSYVCEKGFWLWGATEPIMNHPPHQQIDDFGVWVLELDIGVVKENGHLRIAVGHNSPRHWSCWGYYLNEYLIKIRKCFCLRYRPVFLFFEVKEWSYCAPTETLALYVIVLPNVIVQHDTLSLESQAAFSGSNRAGRVCLVPHRQWPCRHSAGSGRDREGRQSS